MNRVGIRKWYRLDVGEDIGVLGVLGEAKIPRHPIGIGANNDEIRYRAAIGVEKASWEDKHVAGRDLDTTPVRTA